MIFCTSTNNQQPSANGILHSQLGKNTLSLLLQKAVPYFNALSSNK